MNTCLGNWAGGELFSGDLLESPRLMALPELVEPDLPSGTGLRTIGGFRAVFVNAIGFSDLTYHPGDPDATILADGPVIEQTTSFLLPLTPIIADWVATGPEGLLRFQEVELFG